jgi:DNA polymerase III epsilon subunit-like protein
MTKTEGLEEMINSEIFLPRILTIDIETSPIVAYTWGPKWETNLIEVVEQGQIICYSAKYLNGKQITKALPDYKGYKPGKLDDKNLVKDIHKLISNSDIVVTQNGVNFDMKYINSRFLIHNLPPASPYKNIDTKIEAKRYLRMPSYSLDDMGEYFGLGRKMEHEGFALWKKCMAGDKQAWNKMKKYNAQDVLLTEKVYLKLRPFMKTHPNVAAFDEVVGCPKCGSEDFQKRGYQVNTSVKYQRVQCNDCHGWYKIGKAIPLEYKPGVNI